MSHSQSTVNRHFMLFGANGSGKTTQGRMLAGCLDRQYVDMSRVLKLGSAYDPSLSQEFAKYSGEGELVPDEVIFSPFHSYLRTLRKGDQVVISGIPRQVPQVDPFYAAITEHLGSTALSVADLILTPADAIRRCERRAEKDRLAGRPPRSEDTDHEKIEKRIKIYTDAKTPVLEALADRGADVVSVECHEEPQVTLIRILSAFKISPTDMFFRPEGYCNLVLA